MSGDEKLKGKHHQVRETTRTTKTYLCLAALQQSENGTSTLQKHSTLLKNAASRVGNGTYTLLN
jgi:hypothetical protein